MRLPWAIAIIAAGLPWLPVLGGSEARAQIISTQRDGGLAIAGRSVRCANANGTLDRHLPNLGAAMPGQGLVVLNPTLLGRQPQVVRLFVFYHECGHHYVGASELGADCWAVGQGVRQGWLDRTGLRQVCRSFGNAPATATHPAGKERCANLERCMAGAGSARAQRQPPASATRAPARAFE